MQILAIPEQAGGWFVDQPIELTVFGKRKLGGEVVGLELSLEYGRNCICLFYSGDQKDHVCRLVDQRERHRESIVIEFLNPILDREFFPFVQSRRVRKK